MFNAAKQNATHRISRWLFTLAANPYTPLFIILHSFEGPLLFDAGGAHHSDLQGLNLIACHSLCCRVTF